MHLVKRARLHQGARACFPILYFFLFLPTQHPSVNPIKIPTTRTEITNTDLPKILASANWTTCDGAIVVSIDPVLSASLKLVPFSDTKIDTVGKFGVVSETDKRLVVRIDGGVGGGGRRMDSSRRS